jgi:hypothetical protein
VILLVVLVTRWVRHQGDVRANKDIAASEVRLMALKTQR